MNVNFPLLLVLATFVCGLIWLIDALFFARNRRRKHLEEVALTGSSVQETGGELLPWPVEYARSFFPVLLIVLVLRSFIFEPFRIPSGSMIPTLLIGDFILVNKFSYGVRLPVIHTKILETGSPERGDVAVFRWPEDERLDYIKRVVGLPGDKIVYQNKTWFINGEEAVIADADRYIDPLTEAESRGDVIADENLLGVEHQVLFKQYAPAGNQPRSWDVPEGHYFLVGDNRDNSNDSRVWGFVPEANLVGKAVRIWLNYRNRTILWNRIGDRIR